MPIATYSEVMERVQHLDADDQLRLLEELAALVRRQVGQPPRRSILELQGLGKEIWQDIDVQEYIEQERASWHG